jgi:hypothetical protein
MFFFLFIIIIIIIIKIERINLHACLRGCINASRLVDYYDLRWQRDVFIDLEKNLNYI